MVSVKCFECGRVNSKENNVCEHCGEELLSWKEYKQKFQELNDFKVFRKRYSISSIILMILILLLFIPAVKWLVPIVITMPGTELIPVLIFEYAAWAVLIVVFLIVVLPMILGRWKILRRYRWTRERIGDLDRELELLPIDFFETDIQGDDESQAPVRKIQGPPIVLLVTIITLLVLVYANKYTDFKPLENFKFLNTPTTSIGNEKAKRIEGQYDCHLGAANLGQGVMRSKQTWSYVFYTNGTYKTYLEGHQQFSGTWSQSGNSLTINVPAIANASPAYSSKAVVSQDGNSFTSGDKKFIKVK